MGILRFAEIGPKIPRYLPLGIIRKQGHTK